MSSQFSSGLDLANLLVTSLPLHQSWAAIENEKQKLNPNAPPSLHISRTEQSDCTVITFLTSPMSFRGQEGLISSSTFRDKNLPDFDFLCSKSKPSFSINEMTMNLFASRYNELCLLKSEISKPNTLVIITGHSMGGCVATLFTLWLLESLNLSKTKRPLCITFGSPLLGDENLRKCVLQFSTWNSCFLHVASIQDPVPKVFLSQNPTAPGTVSQASAYKPFGTFLLCSDSGCACFEDPESILQLLVAVNSQSLSTQAQDLNVGIQFFHYGQILEGLKLKAFCKHVFELDERDRGSQEASIITQLAAIFGVLHSQELQQQQPNLDFESLKTKMKRHEDKLANQKAMASNAAKKLNDSKKSMVQLEWYKMESKKSKTGYYDMYKKQRDTSDIDVDKYKRKLSNYWEDEVAEAENKPQKEGAPFRTGWLMGGTNYRRMVEPLHIAEFYKKGGKDYQNKNTRPRHFVLLEQWLRIKEEEDHKKKEAERIKKGEAPRASPSMSKAQNVASSLTDDSCFWSHVEEALILCNLPENEQKSTPVKEKFTEFENYVLDALKNFAVTPDIFLSGSSFMEWWKKYNEVVGSSTQLARIMREGTYSEYENGVKVVA